MALIKCSECGREISDKAAACPGCGAPILASGAPATPIERGPEETLLLVHRAIFRENPIVLLVLIGIPLAVAGFALAQRSEKAVLISGIGLSLVLGLFFVMWLVSRAESLTVTNRRLIYRKGLLSKSTSEVLHHHIRNIQITQSFFERMMGVGKLGVSSAGQADFEIVFKGIRDPQRVKETIDSHRF